MKDEIKEILETFKKINEEYSLNTDLDFEDYEIPNIYLKQLLDYITNLQEENEELKIENEKLTQLWLDSQEKRRKAIKYLKQPYRDNFDYSKSELIEILGDDDNE